MPQSIQDWLDWAYVQLNQSPSPKVDARVLLCDVLEREPSYLMTWPDRQLSAEQAERFSSLIRRRAQGEPVAYIIGYRDFWTLRLKVAPSTLIPRADTEILVEQALNLPLPDDASVLDLGTGTGAIALSLASERPDWQLVAVDKEHQAVQLAEQNRATHNLANVECVQSDWFNGVNQGQFDLIVSNPPYVEANSPYLKDGDVRFEPDSALTAGYDGLDDIRLIISDGKERLTSGGWIMLEHGFEQGEAVSALFNAHKYQQVTTVPDLAGLDRVTFARKL